MQQLRQLGDISGNPLRRVAFNFDRNPSRLILAEQLGGRSPAQFIPIL
jgi:hypothetical protein